MEKSEDDAKVGITVRVKPDIRARLRGLAEQNETTVSELVNLAIERYLVGGSPPDREVFLTKEEVEKVLPVVQAIGHPVPLTFFLEAIILQRGEKL